MCFVRCAFLLCVGTRMMIVFFLCKRPHERVSVYCSRASDETTIAAEKWNVCVMLFKSGHPIKQTRFARRETRAHRMIYMLCFGHGPVQIQILKNVSRALVTILINHCGADFAQRLLLAASSKCPRTVCERFFPYIGASQPTAAKLMT